MGITASSVVIQTTEGYAVAEPGIQAKMGGMVLLELSGRLVFAEVGAKRFLTNDGIIEGDRGGEYVVKHHQENHRVSLGVSLK